MNELSANRYVCSITREPCCQVGRPDCLRCKNKVLACLVRIGKWMAAHPYGEAALRRNRDHLFVTLTLTERIEM